LEIQPESNNVLETMSENYQGYKQRVESLYAWMGLDTRVRDEFEKKEKIPENKCQPEK
jgi:hypothetical protein